MRIIYHGFTIATYYSVYGILVETKFSDSKCMSIQCVRFQTLVLLELASSHWKLMISGHIISANQCPCVTQHNNKTYMMFNMQFCTAGFRTNHIFYTGWG